MKRRCKVCNNLLFSEPLFKLENAPKSAQYFPDESNLKKDRGISLRVYQCSGCGLVQLSTKPVKYFREVIRAVGISKEMMDFRRTYFKGFVDRYNLSNKKAIEIGCGSGDYLSIICEFIPNSYGLEYSDSAIKNCREKGLRVFRGFIENDDYRIEESPFDAFFCLSFLEHVPSPNSFLRGIWNNLSNDAFGIVEVPNFDMILRKSLFSEFITDHLFYFSKETLFTTLRLNGFEVLEIKEIWHDYILSAEVKKKKSLDLSSFQEKLNRFIEEIDEFCRHFKRVAVWGAGHQALLILSQIKSKKNIRYVIDSARFKQNKFTPSTHIPVLAPEILDKNPVEAVIVMAGSYSNEVVEILRQKHGRKIRVAVLSEEGLKKLSDL